MDLQIALEGDHAGFAECFGLFGRHWSIFISLKCVAQRGV
ncbi:MAG: hypothetical protein RLZZ476_167 [Verrucomicrobiota bacterium]